METLTLTAKELADRTGTDYATVTGLLKFLSVKGLAKKAGNAPRSGGKGKTALLWSVPCSVTLDLETRCKPLDRTVAVVVKEMITSTVEESGTPADTLPDGTVGVHQK